MFHKHEPPVIDTHSVGEFKAVMLTCPLCGELGMHGQVDDCIATLRLAVRQEQQKVAGIKGRAA